MVFNDRTYPNFVRMLELLGVGDQPSDMSFSVSCGRGDFEFQGSSLNGLFAQRSNLLRPSFYRMLADILRFNRVGLAALASGALESGMAVGQFLDQHRFSEVFRRHYLVPMVAAVWSAEPRTVQEFPAKFLIGFFRNHGLLQLRDRPQWKTIVGGSRCYVDRLVAPFRDRIRLGCPVRQIRRFADRVELHTSDGRAQYDEVVLACHADQSLRLLADATLQEQELLHAFPYQANDVVLHTDRTLLPRRRRAWASWNYTLPAGENEPATLTYDLSRLQQLPTPEPVLLTLNRTDAIQPQHRLATFSYSHPCFSPASIAAQHRFASISGHNRTHFCGAYWGYGFHEDGVRSALAVAQHFQLDLNACTAASTKDGSRMAGISR